MMNCYFVITDPTDSPIFEAEFFKPDYLTKLENDKTMHQFIIFASLDMLEREIWNTNQSYLKIIDRVMEWNVSAFIAPTGDRFLLMHDVRNEESIKNFFMDVCDLYCRIALNPFYQQGDSIKSGQFEVRVRLLAKKHLDK